MDPRKSILHTETTTYKELEARINWLKNNKPFCHRKIWDLIEYSPISELSICLLRQKNWEVKEDPIDSWCNQDKKIIFIKQELPPYERDKNLFHEIAHAQYGKELNDSGGSIDEHENRTIAEWLARRCRLNSDLLRSTIEEFKLTPYIYDNVSYHAFREFFPNQKVRPLNKVLRD
jgi:hypothetical protein